MSAVFTQAAGEVDAFYEPTDNQVATNMELVLSLIHISICCTCPWA